MAMFPKAEWVGELQKALGLGDKDLNSIEVNIRVATDEIVTASVSYEEFVDDDLVKKVIQCLVPVEFNDVASKEIIRQRLHNEVPMESPDEFPIESLAELPIEFLSEEGAV